MIPEKIFEPGAWLVTWPCKLWALNANSYKMVEAIPYLRTSNLCQFR